MEKTNNGDLNGIPNLEIASQGVEKFQKIIFKGKLLFTNMKSAKKCIYDLVEEADGYIVDMCEIKQIDSSGFGVLINMGKNLITEERNMVVLVNNEFIRELFEISKLNQVFPIVETQKEAVDILTKKRNEDLLKIEEY